MAEAVGAATRKPRHRHAAWALFASDLSPWMRANLIAGALLGLRPGELLGLTWDCVDFGAGILRVRHSLKGKKLEALKTDRSRRTLVMPGKLADALKALRAVQAAERLKLGQHYGDMGLVFGTAAGRPMRLQLANAHFKAACKAAGLGEDWHPHELPHTFVSVLSDAGIDIEGCRGADGRPLTRRAGPDRPVGSARATRARPLGCRSHAGACGALRAGSLPAGAGRALRP